MMTQRLLLRLKHPALILIFTGIGLLLVACQTAETIITPAPTHVSPALNDISWDDRSLFRAGLIRSAQDVLAELPAATVYHIDINIAADLLHLRGHEVLRYTNAEELPLNELYFRLFPNLSDGSLIVDRLQVDGLEITASLEKADSVLRVPLPNALEPGESVEVSMDFAELMPSEMAGNYGFH